MTNHAEFENQFIVEDRPFKPMGEDNSTLMLKQASDWFKQYRDDLPSENRSALVDMLAKASIAGKWLPPHAGWDYETHMDTIAEQVISGDSKNLDALVASIVKSSPHAEGFSEFLGSVANILGWEAR